MNQRQTPRSDLTFKDVASNRLVSELAMYIPGELTIRCRMDFAVSNFLKKDDHLLRVCSSERSMCHQFARYLQIRFRAWHVDCEYNRNGISKKLIYDVDIAEDRSIYPDIIVHKRGTSFNLLIIEAKKSDAQLTYMDLDQKKLDAYLHEGLGYHYGILLTFVVGTKPGINYKIQMPPFHS